MIAVLKHGLMRVIESGLSELIAPYIGSSALRIKEYVPNSARSFAEISTKEFATI